MSRYDKSRLPEQRRRRRTAGHSADSAHRSELIAGFDPPSRSPVTAAIVRARRLARQTVAREIAERDLPKSERTRIVAEAPRPALGQRGALGNRLRKARITLARTSLDEPEA